MERSSKGSRCKIFEEIKEGMERQIQGHDDTNCLKKERKEWGDKTQRHYAADMMEENVCEDVECHDILGSITE